VYGCVHDGNNGFFFGGTPCSPALFHQEDVIGGGAGIIPLRAFFPSDMALSALPRDAAQHQGAWDWLGNRRQLAGLKCRIDRHDFGTHSTRTIIGPQSFANLRATPSLEGEIIAQVRPWTRVTIAQASPVFSGSTDRRNACALACIGIDQNTIADAVWDDQISPTAQTFIVDCVAPHHVWWLVRLDDGTEGYISASLLR